MSGRRMEVLVALVVAGATLAIGVPAGAQAASSHPAMAKKARPTEQHTVKVKEATPGLAAQATISADSAQKIALAQVSHGWIREAELEEEKGTLVYSYDIKARGKSGVEEVLVDARTGAVVSTSHESAKAEAKEAAGEKKLTKTARVKSKPMSKSTATPKPATNGVSTTKP
ncbi:MAG TPA: PepSY domain-containing protein [Gemmatimonadaceae bacterium]|nr:PepSY domain-containing protein [Gemmatimonadaceae bacterium]